jgi:hypothetical protein
LHTLCIDDYSFNKKINQLPKALCRLEIMSCAFDKPLDKLPNKLKTLVLSESYTLPLNHLPESIQTVDRMF